MFVRSRRQKRIDLNRATAEELENIAGIGKGKAIEIIDMREALGGFTSVDDLKSIRGIGSTILDANKDTFYCLPPSTCGSTKGSSSRMERSNSRRSLRNRLSDGDSRHEGETNLIKRKLSLKNETCSPEKKICTTDGVKVGGGEMDGTLTTRCRHLSGSTMVTNSPEMENWLQVFQAWTFEEKKHALDELMARCNPPIIRHVMSSIEPRFQRDFISLLPKELAFYVLCFLGPKDLVQAAQTCKYWRILCDDNLLWKEKCSEYGIDDEPVFLSKSTRRKNSSGNHNRLSLSVCPSPYKKMFLRKHKISMNWRYGPTNAHKMLKGHDDYVITCLQFGNNRIVSGSDDHTLRVWSAITGKCLRTLSGHTGGVWASQMEDNLIVSGSTDRTLKVWNADTGLCLHTLYGHTSTVRCMDIHGKVVVSGSRDATLRVWDIDSGECLHVLVGHVAAVRCVKYDGRRVVSGAYDYLVKVWDPETEQCIHTLQGHSNRVYSLQFDGIYIVSGSLDTSIRVWHVDTGQCLHTLVGHQSLTSGMELRNNILVSGNADSTVKIWDITSGQCLQTLAGPNKHQSAVTCLQFNKKFVITSSDDGTVKLWDIQTGEFIRDLVKLDSGGSGGVVWRVRCNETKLVCAVGSRNGTEETKLLVLDFGVHE